MLDQTHLAQEFYQIRQLVRYVIKRQFLAAPEMAPSTPFAVAPEGSKKHLCNSAIPDKVIRIE